MQLRVAYLINQYPKVSHSFIRREILALERRGIAVQRIAVRGWDGELVDGEDQAERRRTQYVLERGVAALIPPLLRRLASHPGAFGNAMTLMFKLAWKADRSFLFHLNYFAQACQIADWIDDSGASHLHAHFGTNPAELAVLVGALGGPPCSFTVHGPEEFDRPERLQLALKVLHSKFVVAISSFGRSQLFRWIAQEQWSKVQVVKCGLDPLFYADAPFGMRPSHRLVCVGRICEQKGQLLLLLAAHRLIQDGKLFELVIAGDGEMRAEVEAMIESLSLRKHVRITGWISSAEVRAELLAARALVLPSFAEGLPVVVMEAMALRRPVITTWIAGIPELVVDGRSGWLCAASDVDALARAMAACLSAPDEELARMGDAAHEAVCVRHDVDVEAAKLAGLFERTGQVRPVSAS